jgi:sensor histidine kinase YesM
MQENINNKIKANILGDINKGEIKVKPKWLFTFKAISFFIFILFLFAFTFYILAFTAFIIRDHDWIIDTTFSIKGIYLLLNALPFTLLFASLFMIAVASLVSRKYSLSYKKPFIYTLMTIIAILLLSHFAFVSSGARNFLKEEAYARGIKLAPSNLLELRKDMQKMRIYENI